ncbi:MAG: OmpA family protein [Clostridia bacterium]|nr:OmpA family protein [Deltaproteobacteria bacterium]
MRSFALFVTLVAAQALTRIAIADNHIALQRFDPSQAGDSFFGVAAPPSDLQNLAIRSRLTLNWARNPLVLENPGNGNQVNQVVQDQVIVNVGVAVELKKRFTLSIDVPLAIAQGSGEIQYDIRSAGGAHVGDIRFGARVQLVAWSTLAKLSVAGFFFAPLGANESSAAGTYMSDGSSRGRVDVIAHGDNGKYVWSFGVGPELRESQDFFTVRQGNALHIAGGFGVRFLDNRIQIGPETRAILTLSESSKYNRNWEALLGVRYHKPIGFTGGVAAGPGLASGVGTPDFRVIATLGYAFSFDKPAKAPAPVDTDNDGIDDAHDGCPTVAGSADNKGCQPPTPAPVPAPVPAPLVVNPPDDRDNDGVADARDACVEVPGPADNDGCPVATFIPAAELAAKVIGNEIVILQQIQFETGSDVIKGESVPTMEAILAAVQSVNADSRFLIEGFTDNRGAAKKNKALSEKRATSVVKWLGEHGVDEGRFTATGLGAARPLQTNDTEDGRRANRRVEIHISK